MVRTAWLWVSTLTLWDSTCSYLLKIAKLIFKVACIWDPLGYYCCLNYIIFKFQSPIVNFINLYNIWPEITCTFKKKKNKVKIVKVPSVVEVTTCISVADGLILLLYSIRHHERTLLLGYSKFYCLCRKNIIWRSPTPPLVEKIKQQHRVLLCIPFFKMKNNNCKLNKSHFF